MTRHGKQQGFYHTRTCMLLLALCHLQIASAQNCLDFHGRGRALMAVAGQWLAQGKKQLGPPMSSWLYRSVTTVY